MKGQSTRKELKILLRDIKETLCLKNSFGTGLEGRNYELSPYVNLIVIKLPFQYSALCKFYWLMICLNILNILMEQTWSLSTEKNTTLKIRSMMSRYLYVYVLGNLSTFPAVLTVKELTSLVGFNLSLCALSDEPSQYISLNLGRIAEGSSCPKGTVSAAILMTNRGRIISGIRKFKALQWSLHWIDPEVKAAIGRRGQIQSLLSEFFLFLIILYAVLMGKQIGTTFLMSSVISLHQPLLKDLLYFFECFNFGFCIFFAAIIPHLCIYFATEAEVQTRLFSAYVSKLTRMYNSSVVSTNQPSYHRKVYSHLRIILDRHLELKRFNTDNAALITSIGLIYIISGIFSFTCNLYEYVQNDINLLMCGMNICFLITVAMYTFFCGQTYEDEWRNYHREICKLPWYIWTVANRKSYLLILMGSSKTTKIRLINQIAVNYGLLLQILKYIYTSTNAACNLYKKKDARSSPS